MEKKFSDLQESYDEGKFNPFIKEIQFPFFKNMEKKSRLEFVFPITALVGANGSSKSSILHALYGSPSGKNIGDYWFSTAIDPIEESSERNCYIYKYFNKAAKKDVEILIQRSPYRKGEGDPDYWESSRPVAEYGMESYEELKPGETRPGGSKTRWNMIKKPVLHIDFRSALPAFDKFFYHDSQTSSRLSLKGKKQKIRRRSSRLKKAIDHNLKSEVYHKKQRISEPSKKLSQALVNTISSILGKKYQEINIIKHSYFDCDAYTAIMSTDTLNYTEAFAGSGEFSVIYLVYKISSAEPYSLILLDEPEVSLHPGAQDKIIDFITNECFRKKHQIIMTTHSPALIRRLPEGAIKVLGIDPATNKTKIISQSAHPEEAFFYIGEKSTRNIKIIVEDKLAALFVTRSLAKEPKAIRDLINIKYYPGGVAVLWGHYIPACAAEHRKDVMFLLDGDMRPKVDIPQEQSIPQIDDDKVAAYLKTLSDGHYRSIPIDGGPENLKKANAIKNDRALLSWSQSNVNFLPGSKNPECLLWKITKPDSYRENATAKDAKLFFERYTADLLQDLDEAPCSEDIFADQKRLVASIENNNDYLKSLNQTVMNFFKERMQS